MLHIDYPYLCMHARTPPYLCMHAPRRTLLARPLHTADYYSLPRCGQRADTAADPPPKQIILANSGSYYSKGKLTADPTMVSKGKLTADPTGKLAADTAAAPQNYRPIYY